MELGVSRVGPAISTACHIFSLVPLQSLGGKNDEWLKRRKHSTGRWRKKLKLLYWLQSAHKRGEGEDYEEEDEELEMEWLSPSPTTEEHLELWEADTHVGTLGSHEGKDWCPEMGLKLLSFSLEFHGLDHKTSTCSHPAQDPSGFPPTPAWALTLGRALWAFAQVPASVCCSELVQKAVPYLYPGG